jgi:hypothetical protein
MTRDCDFEHGRFSATTATLGAMSTVVFVDPGVGDTLPAALRGPELMPERRAGRLPAYPGPERRRRPAPRLEHRGAGLAVVHTCPDCGRVSIVPYAAGAGLAAAPPCACAAPLAAPAPSRLQAFVVGGALVLLWILNLEDVLLTRRALALGATEVNVIMGFFLRFGFVPAALIKMAIVTAGAIFLWTQHRRRIVVLASVGLVTVYVTLVIYQMIALAG